MNIDDARQWRVDNSWKSFVVWILYCSSPFQQFHESSRLIQNFYWGTSSEFTSLPSTLQPYNKITKNSIESHFHNLRRIFKKRKIHKIYLQRSGRSELFGSTWPQIFFKFTTREERKKERKRERERERERRNERSRKEVFVRKTQHYPRPEIIFHRGKE